jgi:hypothetical protein
MAEKSAMQKSPGKKRQANPERIQRRLEYLRGANPDDPRIAKLEKRLEKAGGMPEEPVVPFGEATAQQFQGLSSPEQIGQLQTGAGQNIQSYLQQLQAQGAFQPGEYEDTYQQAYQNVMGQFESQTAPEFARQNEAVEAAIAQRGIDPTGTQAQRLREQAYQNQAQARQQAMYQAEQMGRGLQQQRFQQELTQYQVPTAQLQALQGYYTGQLGQVEAQRQREFEAQQQQKQRALQRELSARGGGSPDPFALMQAEYGYKRDLLYDAQVLQGGQQPQQPGIGGSIAQGLAQGIGAGVTSGLMRS